MTNWIKHEGKEPPALAPAAYVKCVEGQNAWVSTVDLVDWRHEFEYILLTNPEGIPYCSAEGLRESTKYVSTNEGGAVFQWVNKPHPSLGSPGAWVGVSHALSGENYRHPGDWNDSLMRVWRD